MQNYSVFVYIPQEEIEKIRRFFPDKAELVRLRAEAEERINQRKLVKQKLRKYIETENLSDSADRCP